MKRIIWEQTSLDKREVAAFLTRHNFQPGKFVVVPHPWDETGVLLIYVKEEL